MCEEDEEEVVSSFLFCRCLFWDRSLIDMLVELVDEGFAEIEVLCFVYQKRVEDSLLCA